MAPVYYMVGLIVADRAPPLALARQTLFKTPVVSRRSKHRYSRVAGDGMLAVPSATDVRGCFLWSLLCADSVDKVENLAAQNFREIQIIPTIATARPISVVVTKNSKPRWNQCSSDRKFVGLRAQQERGESVDCIRLGLIVRILAFAARIGHTCAVLRCRYGCFNRNDRFQAAGRSYR